MTTAYRREKVILTGGSGRVGQFLARQLCLMGYDVISLSTRKSGNYGFKSNGPEPLLVKLDNYESMLRPQYRSLFVDAAAIIHGAAITPTLFGVQSDFIYRENLRITRAVVNFANLYDIEKVIFLSSVACYGSSPSSIIHSEHEVKPTSSYGRSKLDCETLLKEEFGGATRKFTSLRMPKILLGGSRPIIKTVRSIISHSPIIYLPYPCERRSYLGAKNLLSAICTLIESESAYASHYNLSDDEPLSIEEIINIISEQCGSGSTTIAYSELLTRLLKIFPTTFMAKYDSLSKELILDNSKFKKDHSWTPPSNVNASVMDWVFPEERLLSADTEVGGNLIKISDASVTRRVLIFTLAVGLFMPFAKLPGLPYEIYPFWLLPMFLLTSFDRQLLKKLFTLLAILFFTACIFYSLEILGQLARIGTIVVTLILLGRLRLGELIFLSECLLVLLAFNTLLMLGQKIIVDHPYYLSGAIVRPVAQIVDHRTGGVLGIAPEPSYMAAIIASVALFRFWVTNSIEYCVVIIAFLGILLTGSITGLVLIVVLMMPIIFGRLLKSQNLIVFLLILINAALAIYSWSSFGRGLDRALEFFSTVAKFDIDTLIAFESKMGTQRVTGLIEYYKNGDTFFVMDPEKYNPFPGLVANSTAIFGLPVILTVIFLIVRSGVIKSIAFVGIFYGIFGGPSLIPLMYCGLISRNISSEGGQGA